MENLKVAIEEWGLYNNGILACKWWDSDSDYEEIVKYYQELKEQHGLNDSSDVELFMADWENDEFNLCSEHANIEDTFISYTNLEHLNDYEVDAIKFLVNMQGYDLNSAIDKKDDVIVYEANSYTDLAQTFADEGLFGEIPSYLENYIDYESMGRDLSFDYTQYEGKYYRAD